MFSTKLHSFLKLMMLIALGATAADTSRMLANHTWTPAGQFPLTMITVICAVFAYRTASAAQREHRARELALKLLGILEGLSNSTSVNNAQYQTLLVHAAAVSSSLPQNKRGHIGVYLQSKLYCTQKQRVNMTATEAVEAYQSWRMLISDLLEIHFA